jgi:hypothetical protein
MMMSALTRFSIEAVHLLVGRLQKGSNENSPPVKAASTPSA